MFEIFPSNIGQKTLHSYSNFKMKKSSYDLKKDLGLYNHIIGFSQKEKYLLQMLKKELKIPHSIH